MSCYKININGEEFELASDINSEQEGNKIENFIETLKNHKDSEDTNKKYVYDALSMTLNKLNYNSKADSENYLNKKLSNSQDADLIPIIKSNLKSLGVTMIVVTPEEMVEQYKLAPDIESTNNINALVKDGVIYVKESSFKVSDPIHELSHLIFGVLKIKDFNNYLTVIETLSKNPDVKRIYNEIVNTPEYSTKYELDLQEEAVVRFLEEFIINGNIKNDTFDILGLTIDISDFLDKHLSLVIKNIFGIEKYPGINTLFKSLIADIPIFGSKLFVLPKTDSSGFMDYMSLATKSAQVSQYLKTLSDNNIIEKVDCI